MRESWRSVCPASEVLQVQRRLCRSGGVWRWEGRKRATKWGTDYRVCRSTERICAGRWGLEEHALACAEATSSPPPADACSARGAICAPETYRPRPRHVSRDIRRHALRAGELAHVMVDVAAVRRAPRRCGAQDRGAAAPRPRHGGAPWRWPRGVASRRRVAPGGARAARIRGGARVRAARVRGGRAPRAGCRRGSGPVGSCRGRSGPGRRCCSDRSCRRVLQARGPSPLRVLSASHVPIAA